MINEPTFLSYCIGAVVMIAGIIIPLGVAFSRRNALSKRT